MAITTLTVQEISRAGITAAYTAANSDGSQFANNGKCFIHVKNTNAATRTVTIETTKTVDGKAVADQTVVVAATTGDVMIGPFPYDNYNNVSGYCNISYSAVADLTVGVFRLPS